MNLLQKFRNRKKIAELMEKGAAEEERNDLEAAFQSYEQAAQLGSGKAMAAIGTLYSFKSFRMVEENNIAELISQGMPVFPWNIVRKTVPDQAEARKWYCSAAEQGEATGYAFAGAMLCEGIGGPQELERGLAYLQKAVDLGVEAVRPAISVYAQAKDIHVSDEKYEKMLSDFVDAVEAGKPERHAMYFALKGGTEQQKARLGYTLVTRRNLLDPKYMEFKYLYAAGGVPLIPCCARRLMWKTYLRLELNAFASDDVLIGFASDIGDTVTHLGRLRPAGSAVYRSPDFGWLREEKKAVLFRIDRQCMPAPEEMERLAQVNHLQPSEYQPENVAFMLENGEKEYSAEVVAIADGKVQVLFRYTIGGSDEIHTSFEPELVSLSLT